MTKKAIPVEVQVEKEKTNRELWNEALSAGRQIGVVLANSPAVQMIIGVMIIEALHRIEVEGKPLLSTELEVPMNTVIIGKGAVSSVGDILALINPFN